MNWAGRNDAARTGVAVVGVIVIHGVMLVAVLNVRLSKQSFNEGSDILYFVEPPKNSATEIEKMSSITRQRAKRDRQLTDSHPAVPASNSVESATVEPGLAISDQSRKISAVDWDAERSRSAGKAAEAALKNEKESRLFSLPKSTDREDRRRVHKLGDTERFDNGEIVTWINEDCYATNLPPPSPKLDPNAIRTICKKKGLEPRTDMFDYMKRQYLKDEHAPPAKYKGIFSDTDQCEYSAVACP